VNDITLLKSCVIHSKPYLHHQDYREKYASSNEHSNSQSIRDSHESKYFENKNHPEHSKWRDSRRNNGQHQEQENGKRRN